MVITYVLIGLAAIVLLGVGMMVVNRISPLSLGMHKPVFHVDGVALDGYDVTSYFSGKPTKGSPAFTEDYGGVMFHFESQKSQNEFVAEPEKFLPQFGGYCAKAVSTGFAAPANPEVFAVVDEKLYIFSSADVREEFLKDPQSMATACEAKWSPRVPAPH